MGNFEVNPLSSPVSMFSGKKLFARSWPKSRIKRNQNDLRPLTKSERCESIPVFILFHSYYCDHYSHCPRLFPLFLYFFSSINSSCSHNFVLCCYSSFVRPKFNHFGDALRMAFDVIYCFSSRNRVRIAAINQICHILKIIDRIIGSTPFPGSFIGNFVEVSNYFDRQNRFNVQ